MREPPRLGRRCSRPRGPFRPRQTFLGILPYRIDTRGPMWRGAPQNDRARFARSPCHYPTMIAYWGNKRAFKQGVFNGRYWARTSDPQLVDPPAGFPPRSARFGLFRRKPFFIEVSAALKPIDDKRWQTTYREFRH